MGSGMEAARACLKFVFSSQTQFSYMLMSQSIRKLERTRKVLPDSGLRHSSDGESGGRQERRVPPILRGTPQGESVPREQVSDSLLNPGHVKPFGAYSGCPLNVVRWASE